MKRNDYYRIQEISRNAWRIDSPEYVGMDLFVGEEKALLWDTGYGFGDLRMTVKSITDKPLLVVNSHGHLDHVNGNYQFADCPVYMNERDWAIYGYFNNEAQRRFILKQSEHMITDYSTNTFGNILPEDLDREKYLREKPVKLLPLCEGMSFDLGGMVLDVLETPGHTWGSTALFRRDTKELYLADETGPTVIMSLFGATPEAFRQTLEKLSTLDFTRMIGSHENTWKDREALMLLTEMLSDLDTEHGIRYPAPMRFTDASLSEYLHMRRGTEPVQPGMGMPTGIIMGN